MNKVSIHFLEALHRTRVLDSGPYRAENVIDGLLKIELIQLIVAGDMSLDLFACDGWLLPSDTVNFRVLVGVVQ
jgi:hypothetical protein